MKKRYINMELVKRLLQELPDCTLECSGKYSITFNCQMNDDDITINFDRIVLDKEMERLNGEIAYHSQVYLDNFTDNGELDNTFLIEELSDIDLERLLQLFDKCKVREKKREYIKDLLKSDPKWSNALKGKPSGSQIEIYSYEELENLVPICDNIIVVTNGKNTGEKPKLEVYLNGTKLSFSIDDLINKDDDLTDNSIDRVLELLYH